MPSYQLYFDAKESLKNVKVELTKEQEETRARDREIIKAIDEYYEPYREQWRANGALFNLIQRGTDDVTSNWYLGWARLLINHSTAMLTAGNPKGDFWPVGNRDYKIRALVNSLVEYHLGKCNWQAHQRLWVQDLHTFGNGVTESYSELPIRKKKYEKNGKMIERVVRDLRKAKVGIRRVSPFRAMRSHFITDPDDVPISFRIEEGTWLQLQSRYQMAINADGTKKFDLSQVPIGSHYRAIKLYGEDENCYRIYMLTYGGKPESTYEVCPPVQELGIPIYDKPLSHYKFIERGKVIGGANLQGMSPLAFALFDDQLDGDMETYSTVGMGIPQIISGPESIMQGLVNMAIDNERLRNTVPVSYEPLNSESPSALDLDVRQMYSGLVVDGKITPQPLGQSSAGSNQVLWEWLKFLIYQLSGINVEPLTGDSLNTAYQSGLLMRQMNMRAQARISAWEQGPLKRAFTVLAANALTDVTMEEWEEVTEDDVENIKNLISNDSMTGEDFREVEDIDEEGNKTKSHERRRAIMIPVKGYKFREDFSGPNKTRKIGTKDATDTLIEDPDLQGGVSYVPAVSEYLLPSGTVESILEFDVKVDGSSMLRDLKTQDMEMGKNAIMNAQAIAQMDQEFAQQIDWKKLYMKTVEPTGLTEEDVFKTESYQSPSLKAFKDAAHDLTNPHQDALAPQGTPQPQAAPAPDPRASGVQGEAGGAADQNPALGALTQL